MNTYAVGKFVLQANLPLLQRELLHCARMAKQTPQQYLSQHEQILFDQSSPTTEPQDYSNEVNENGKRRSPDRLVLYSTINKYIEI